ncbi:MAG TPA: cell division protein SepF [Clostridiaceae bacterium]|nr:cell division protein SepF [Clostridiaceae bacterium]
MSFLDKLFGRDVDDSDIYEEYEDDYYEPETEVMRQPVGANSTKKSSRVVNFNQGSSVSNQHHVEIVEPQNMESMWQICDYVREGKTVICNIESISAEHRQRLVDFVTGAAYALEGEIQPVSQLIFVFTPHSTRVSRDRGRGYDDYALASNNDYMRDAKVFAR